MTEKNIVLIGMMGTGKTSVGRLIGESTKRFYVDTDELFMYEYMPISECFAKHGEQQFRIWESKIVERVASFENCVISTGGGVVKDERNMLELKKYGIIVCLAASPETIFERVSHNQNRPLIKGLDLEGVRRLCEERNPIYSKFADITISTEGKSIAQVANEIINSK